MDDISRELEREIAQAKPKPYKQDRKTRILIIDDFGTMKSGEYLKKMVMTLSIVSALCFITAVIFISLYSGLAGRSGNVTEKLDIAEKKVEELTREREVLMARLVISGKEPGVVKTKKKTDPVAAETKVVEKRPLLAKKTEKKAAPIHPTPVMAKTKKKAVPAPKKAAASQVQAPEKKALPEPVPEVVVKKKVDVEKFTVVKDKRSGDLLVRFDIRNTSTGPGDVSGRIFTLLKPEDQDQTQWLVVPTSKLENGVPSEHRKGQYFSIAHFKPVKFRIKNQASPEFFKKAAIYIYTTKGELMTEKLIDITEAR